MDYQTVLYNPIYLVQGVSAVITLPDTTTVLKPVMVLDKTAGIEIKMGTDIQTIVPAAVVRMVELAAQGMKPPQLDYGTISFNGKNWKIVSHRLRPSPNGLDDGEALLVLEDD